MSKDNHYTTDSKFSGKTVDVVSGQRNGMVPNVNESGGNSVIIHLPTSQTFGFERKALVLINMSLTSQSLSPRFLHCLLDQMQSINASSRQP